MASHKDEPRRDEPRRDEPKPTAPSTTDDPYAQYHVVEKGDTLSKIAEHFYGDPTLYPRIFEANRDVLVDPNRIKPGQKLRIP